MKSFAVGLCSKGTLPDDLTYGHTNSYSINGDERKRRQNGDTPIMSGPHDDDNDKDKSTSSSNSGNGNKSGGKKHYWA